MFVFDLIGACKSGGTSSGAVPKAHATSARSKAKTGFHVVVLGYGTFNVIFDHWSIHPLAPCAPPPTLGPVMVFDACNPMLRSLHVSRFGRVGEMVRTAQPLYSPS